MTNNLLPMRDPRLPRQLLQQALGGIGDRTPDAEVGDITVPESNSKRAKALFKYRGKFVLITVEISDPQA